jgi:uncharacterized UBP type Zn finger protein
MTQKCEHIDKSNKKELAPNTIGCEECQNEGENWVALRMCLTCGHVGCCDSSVGLHARKHFENHKHPVIVELPKKSWKWCYEHESYG